MSLLNNIIKPLCDRGILLIVCLFLCGSAVAQDSYVSFQYANRHYFPSINFVDDSDFKSRPIVLSIEKVPEFFMLESIDESWNQRRFKYYNKISTIKNSKELGLVEGTFIHTIRYKHKKYSDNKKYFDLVIPLVMKITDYRDKYLKLNLYYLFRDKAIKAITKSRDMNSSSGRAITLVSADIAGSEVSLKIDGNININGQLIFEDKELVGINQRQNKSWDLDIEQTQRFNIEGNIGDRVSIKAHQDSEADFSFENDLNISYEGKRNDILKKLEAGNISLHLPSSQLVNVGSSSSEGLFGVKMIHQLGPLGIQSIISREQVKKSQKSSSLGSSEGSYINAYNFMKDKYYYLDEYFKTQYYPLDSENKHNFFPYYTVIEHEIWKMIDPHNETIQGDKVEGTARVNPLIHDSNTDYEAATWVKLKEDLPGDSEIGDYEIDRLLGVVRFNNIRSEDIIAISYKIGKYIDINPNDGISSYEYVEFDGENDPALFEVESYFNQMDNGISANLVYNNGTTLKSDCDSEDCIINMKLIKATNKVSDPSSPTWSLMFKNVYSMGSSDISVDGMELDIIYIGGNLDEQTHSEISNSSFLKIFGLDRFDQNGNKGADGKIDNINSNILNIQKGELFFPAYLPFSFDPNGRINSQGDPIIGDSLSFWGTSWNSQDLPFFDDLEEYLPELNDNDNDFQDNSDNGPAMYYELTGSTDIMSEHKFQIKVKHSKSQRSSTYNLGFMIVEGSEEVRLNGTKLTKGTDYTIDYFSGTLNIINPQALDPTANIEISYEENELVSFDQKLLAGVHMKLDFSDNDYLSGGAYFYNQSIIDSKVEVGYEPMRNFLWNIGGKFDTDVNFLTTLTDMIPLIDADKKSSIHLEGEFAKVYPNPNPLGQAFLDDFESSKRTSSPSILQNRWKLSSPPLLYQVDSFDCSPNDNQNCSDIDEWANRALDITKRNSMYWYNPYDDILTADIWPNIETSNRAQNTTTKTLWLATKNNWSSDDWGGITTALYPSDYNQERSKYIDIWIYTDAIQDQNMKLNIDIGHISEDMNDDNILNSEDQAIFGNIGNNILDEGEDVGFDGCVDEYEDGNGACLSIIDGTFTSICNSILVNEDIINNWRYYVISGVIPDINYDLCQELPLDENSIHIDPNKDNFLYTEGTDNYERINGSEGNGDVQGYVYPDTEDLDGDYLQDFNNDYFTYTINPLIDIPIDSTQTNTGQNTGWKLFRINLSDFNPILPEEESNLTWSDVRMMRLWVQGEGDNLLGIAKIEIVGSQWEEMGEVTLDSLDYENSYEINEDFFISVINSDENSDYESPGGVQGEYDEYNQIRLKEQSLVMDFEDSGISSGSAINIKKILTYMSNDNKDNFFAYEKLKMFVNGQPSIQNDWLQDSLNHVSLIFRLGKEDEYYEIRQPIYSDWDERNHVDINLEELTKKKLDIASFDTYFDFGIDSVLSVNENGCGGALLNAEYMNKIEEIYLSMDPSGSLTCEGIEEESQSCDDIFSFVWDQIPSGYIDYSNNYFTNPADSLLFVCGPGNENWSSHSTLYDPNGDDFSDSNSIGYEGNGQYDLGENYNDLNFDGIYNSPPDNYNESLDLYTWQENLENLCGNCSEFIIRGEPAINRIEHVMVGVANESDQKIYGQIYINELRFTGIKKDRGKAFRLSGKVNFSDLISFESQYKLEEADFHRLQERLGAGNTTENFNFKTSIKGDKILPTSWGINIPVYLNYSLQNSTPKYYPYQPDVLTGNPQDAPDEIKSLNKTVSLSTSFSKSTRSKNWLIKNTLDKINFNYSIIRQDKSSVTVLNDFSTSQNLGISYDYNFSKDNYIMPFQESTLINKFFTKAPILKVLTKPIIEKIEDTKIYYSPDKITTDMSFSENDQLKIMRQGLDSTQTNSLDLNRKITINHKIFDNFHSNYTVQVGSDLYHEMKENDLTKIELLENMNSGLIESISQSFSNTFSPKIFSWLEPQFKYSPSYMWSLGNPSDEVQTSTIKNSSNFETKFDLNPKEVFEIFYNPSSKAGEKENSGRRGRRGSRNNSNDKNKKDPLLKNIKNPFVISILESMHSFMGKFSKLQFRYELSQSHTHNNVLADQYIDYYFRFGLIDAPQSVMYSDQEGQLGSFTHSYNHSYRITMPSISIIPSISLTSLEFKADNSSSIQSTSIPSSNSGISYFPFPWGVYGDQGLFLPSWGLTWSGLEKISFISDNFKSFKFSHNAKGQKSSTYQDGELLKTDYSLLFSPLIKLSARSKGKNPIDFEIGSKYGLDIFSEGSSVEHETNTQIYGKIEYSRSKGIYIPLPILRDLDLRNTVSFSFNADFEMSNRLVAYEIIKNKSELNLDDRNSKLSLSPKMSYQFSQWVTGNIFFKYILTDDINTGLRNEKDFGFNLTIQIRG